MVDMAHIEQSWDRARCGRSVPCRGDRAEGEVGVCREPAQGLREEQAGMHERESASRAGEAEALRIGCYFFRENSMTGREGACSVLRIGGARVEGREHATRSRGADGEECGWE